MYREKDKDREMKGLWHCVSMYHGLLVYHVNLNKMNFDMLKLLFK